MVAVGEVQSHLPAGWKPEYTVLSAVQPWFKFIGSSFKVDSDTLSNMFVLLLLLLLLILLLHLLLLLGEPGNCPLA